MVQVAQGPAPGLVAGEDALLVLRARLWRLRSDLEDLQARFGGERLVVHGGVEAEFGLAGAVSSVELRVEFSSVPVPA